MVSSILEMRALMSFRVRSILARRSDDSSVSGDSAAAAAPEKRISSPEPVRINLGLVAGPDPPGAIFRIWPTRDNRLSMASPDGAPSSAAGAGLEEAFWCTFFLLE